MAAFVQLCKWLEDDYSDKNMHELKNYYVPTRKIDGIRAVWDGKHLWSRWGKRFNPSANFMRLLPVDGTILDGELFFKDFISTCRIVKTIGSDWDYIEYNVFEAVPPEIWWSPRTFTGLQGVKTTWKGKPGFADSGLWNYMSGLDLARKKYHRIIEPDDKLTMDIALEHGYEGIVHRKLTGIWEPTRSTNALKDKPVMYANGLVTGTTAGAGRLAGMIGALEVFFNGNISFKLAGLTDADRRQPPEYWIGKTVRFKFREYSEYNVPREARFSNIVQ